ncbi:hypothetical protein [Streptosporangium carneum]|uniref:Secreted protein n=1 Tax=Streptosporangium carneum TaxID=47481 RepID=A0A9W6MA18_9ACTN|nr:hypothetical protein [Streptosporangium carneum]GLK06834.1 hypothetical protein GCM10017600_02390 [Streptosporangium carneum]
MNRTFRSLLGLAAATAVLAVGVPGLTSSASAATATASSVSSSADYDEWSTHYSKYYDGSRAKARVHVWDDEPGEVHIQGKLYDKYSPKWLCGYVQIKFENENGDESYKDYKQCGSNGYRAFHLQRYDIDNVQVRTCYWDAHHNARKYCGRWDYVYEVDGGDDDE